MKLTNIPSTLLRTSAQCFDSDTSRGQYKSIILALCCVAFLSGCSVFPDRVSEEMQEDPNPQTNNFF